jgi:hypothetical protein
LGAAGAVFLIPPGQVISVFNDFIVWLIGHFFIPNLL